MLLLQMQEIKYDVGVASNCLMFIPNTMKISHLVLKLKEGDLQTNTHIHTVSIVIS